MEPRCTCGAILPLDARFCHKCGKPQYEEDLARLSEQESAAPIIPALSQVDTPLEAASRISFRNSRAVAISGVVAGIAFFCSGLASLVSPLLWPVMLLAAGFVASVVYKSRSPEPLTSAGGARLGWMTGLWLFLVLMLAATLVSIYLASPAGADVVQQLQSMPQFAQLSVKDRHELVMSILVSAVPTFFMVTLIAGLGGMLGARSWTKGRPTS